MARSIARTHLAQSDYAMHMGINPINFEGCTVDGLFQSVSGCDSVWPRFAWQTSSNASREDLALQISDAEEVIGKFALGFNVKPIDSKLISSTGSGLFGSEFSSSVPGPVNVPLLHPVHPLPQTPFPPISIKVPALLLFVETVAPGAKIILAPEGNISLPFDPKVKLPFSLISNIEEVDKSMVVLLGILIS